MAELIQHVGSSAPACPITSFRLFSRVGGDQKPSRCGTKIKMMVSAGFIAPQEERGRSHKGPFHAAPTPHENGVNRTSKQINGSKNGCSPFLQEPVGHECGGSLFGSTSPDLSWSKQQAPPTLVLLVGSSNLSFQHRTELVFDGTFPVRVSVSWSVWATIRFYCKSLWPLNIAIILQTV